MHGSFSDDTRLRHFFHGVHLFLFLLFDFPDFPKAASSDDVVELEMSSVDC